MTSKGPVLKAAEEEELGLLKKDISRADIQDNKYKKR